LTIRKRDQEPIDLRGHAHRTALEEAIAVHEEWPAREIVCADLTPEHGEIEQTGKDPHHHSLWLRRLALAAHAVLFRKAP